MSHDDKSKRIAGQGSVLQRNPNCIYSFCLVYRNCQQKIAYRLFYRRTSETVVSFLLLGSDSYSDPTV